MSTHTPGPWMAVQDHEGGDYWRVTFHEGTGNIVRLDRRKDGNSEYASRAEADARLISAAPDLLEACHAAIFWLLAAGYQDVIAARDLLAAMAKAEGR